MTDDRMALAELLQKSGDSDFLRAVAEAVLQILMEADVEGLIGAGRHERSLDTRLGSLQLRIPKLRQGSYFPPFLDPRKTAEKAYPSGVGRSSGADRDHRRLDVRLRRGEGKCPQTRLWTQASGGDGIGRGRRL